MRIKQLAGARNVHSCSCLLFTDRLEENIHHLGQPQAEPQPQGAAQVSEERDPAEPGEVRVVESESLVQCEVEGAVVVGSADLGDLSPDDRGLPARPRTVRLSGSVKQILQLGQGFTAQLASRRGHLREVGRGPEW